MKKIILFPLFLCLGAFSISSCSDDDKLTAEEALVIPESQTNVALEPTSKSFSVNIRHELDFETKINCDWIHLVKTPAQRAYVSDQLDFTVDENLTDEAREATVSIVTTNGEFTRTITIKQGAAVLAKDSKLQLGAPEHLKNAKLTLSKVTLTSQATGSAHEISGFATATLDGVSFEEAAIKDIPVGKYLLSVEGMVNYTIAQGLFDTDGTAVEEGGKASSVDTSSPISFQGEVTLESGKSIAQILTTGNRKHGLVLSEIFLAGSKDAKGKTYLWDQYFKITNNSDHVIYADSVLLIESLFNTQLKNEYRPDIMEEAMGVGSVYMIPGTGTQYPIEPGKSKVIAVNARNHKEANPNSIDMTTGVDFEIYDESPIPTFADTDSEVPNMDKWYTYSFTFFIANSQGCKAYAIADARVNKDTYLEDYKYSAAYNSPVNGRLMLDEGYLVPNSWVIDAVDIAPKNKHEWNIISSSLDAGWTYFRTGEKGEDSAFKSLVRKMKDGKYVDTNNSTNDFEIKDKPTLFP